MSRSTVSGHEWPWWTVLIIPQNSWLWGLWQGLGVDGAGSAGGRLCRQHPRTSHPQSAQEPPAVLRELVWNRSKACSGVPLRSILCSGHLKETLGTLALPLIALLTFLQEFCGWQDSVFHFTVNKPGLGCCYKFWRDEWLTQEEQPYSTNGLCTLSKHPAPLPVPEMYSLSCRCVGESVVGGLFRAI